MTNILDDAALSLISTVFDVSPIDITDIALLKKGMTNKSVVFAVHGNKYILRIPGKGTAHLISRWNEAESYKAINGKGICQKPLYINPETGFMITKFLENARVCDPNNEFDVKRCMEKLKMFHNLKLKVNYEFDIFNMIDFYETLLEGKPSEHKDYMETKQNIMSLKSYIDANSVEKYLTHIDAIPDNFIFFDDDNTEKIWLNDWEYAGMQDPHVDLAMFSIYSFYGKEQIDRLIGFYFDSCGLGDGGSSGGVGGGGVIKIQELKFIAM